LTRSGPVVRYTALVAVAALAYWLLGRHDFSIGVDAGTHFGIAVEVEQYGWPLPAQSFLHWISHYPPAAHMLAIGIGWLLGSTLYGLYAVTAIALTAIYLSLAALMRRSDPAETAASILVLILLAAALRSFRFLAGNEVVIHFFYAHFAGTAVFLACFVLIARLRASFLPWLLVAAVAVHVTGWFFPLSAIQLGIAGAALRLRPCTKPPIDTRRRAVETTVTGLVLGATALLHPAILDMVMISANDGAILINDTTMLVCTFVLAFICIPAIVILAPRSNLLHSEALVAVAIAAMVPAGLLLAAYVILDIGSPYAVRKSGFLIGTLTLVFLACLFTELPRVKSAARRAQSMAPRAVAAVFPMLGALLVAGALAFVLGGRPRSPVSPMVSYDREIAPLIQGDLGSVLAGVTVSNNSNYDPRANYMVAYARLRTGAPAWRLQVQLMTTQPQPGGDAEYVVVSDIDAERFPEGCRFAKEGRVVVLRYDCAQAP
jgi:hypothetical protein